jgi:hypothetical protein
MTASARRDHGDQARLRDDTVRQSLEHADAEAIARSSPTEFAASATGRVAWQVLAGAAEGCRFQGRLLWDEELDGLRYFVVSWTNV